MEESTAPQTGQLRQLLDDSGLTQLRAAIVRFWHALLRAPRRWLTLPLDFIPEARNLILLGSNGRAKPMILENIAHAAVLAGHSALFCSASELLEDLQFPGVAQTEVQLMPVLICAAIANCPSPPYTGQYPAPSLRGASAGQRA
ncbi:MAG: ATP-binding protein [Acidobacteriota bacterium]